MFDALFGQPAGAQIEIGSIGWDDADEYFFPGEASNDGHTLVRVQLFRGRDFTKPISDRAQGVKLVCHVPDGNFRVPTKNARCYVAIPQGMDCVPGAGVIVATVGAGNEVLRNITPGDVVICPTGAVPGQATMLARQDGTLTHFTTDNNLAGGQSIYSRVGRGVNEKTGTPDGFTWAAPWGTLKFDPTGFHVVLKESGAEFHLGGMGGLPPPLDVLSSYCNITAGTFHANSSSAAVGVGAVQLANAQAIKALLIALNTACIAFGAAADGPGGTGAGVAAASTLTTAISAAAAIMTTTASADL